MLWADNETDILSQNHLKKIPCVEYTINWREKLAKLYWSWICRKKKSPLCMEVPEWGLNQNTCLMFVQLFKYNFP